jgi:competence protein ComEC
VWRRVALIAAVAALGIWRYQSYPIQACLTSDDLAAMHTGQEHGVAATLTGVVVAYPEVREGRATYRVRAQTLLLPGSASRPIRGDVRVQADAHPLYAYGDQLRITGDLQDPPVFADFDYRTYLARHGIRSDMRRAEITKTGSGGGQPLKRVLYGLRARASQVLNRILPEPAAALANGMLLGIESGIPRELGEAYRMTGASHVIVISGSNIALLAAVFLALLGPLIGYPRAAIPVGAAIVLYVLLVGADPAAARAGLMGLLYVGALALGRQNTAWVALAASALVMTAINPLTLWDIGFQISFAATLGLILFAQPLTDRLDGLTRGHMSVLVGGALAATLAAQIAVLPVLLYHFGQFSWLSPLVNALIVPAQPPILVGGMVALLLGLVWEPLGRITAIVPWLFLTYTTAVVQLGAKAQFAMLDLAKWSQPAGIVTGVIIVGGWAAQHLTRTGWLAWPNKRVIAIGLAAALPLWASLTVLAGAPDGRLHVTYLTDDDNATVLLTTPAGVRLYLRNGSQPMQSGRVLDVTKLPQTGLRIAPGITLEPIDAEGYEAAVLRYNNFRTVLPILLDEEAQAALARRGDLMGQTVLVGPGPDTGHWPIADWLAATQPQLFLWPEATGYPPGTVAALEAFGTRAVRVPEDTIVEIVTDGRRVWLRRTSGGLTRVP